MSFFSKKIFLLTKLLFVTKKKVKKNVQNENTMRNVSTTRKTGILYVLSKNVHYSKTYIWKLDYFVRFGEVISRIYKFLEIPNVQNKIKYSTKYRIENVHYNWSTFITFWFKNGTRFQKWYLIAIYINQKSLNKSWPIYRGYSFKKKNTNPSSKHSSNNRLLGCFQPWELEQSCRIHPNLQCQWYLFSFKIVKAWNTASPMDFTPAVRLLFSYPSDI